MRPGLALGPYVLLRPIGHGGSATVWAARHDTGRGLSRIVALKTITPEYADNAQYRRMLMHEARLAAAVNHPNLCELYDVGTQNGVLYLALEWADGASLQALINASRERQGLEPAIAARIVADACAGLHALHEAKGPTGEALAVIHRDVSPHNILLTSDGYAKLSDFGVAKARDEYSARTRSGHVKGKLGYVAPEQLTGVPIDHRVDVFGMGCVLYTSCLGKLAFPANRAELSRVVRGEYVPPLELRPDLPVPLAHIIERALQLDPGERFRTADEMRTALENWLVQSGCVILQSQVAAALGERLGQVIQERNSSIRQAAFRVGAAPASAWTPALRADTPTGGPFPVPDVQQPGTEFRATSPSWQHRMRVALLWAAVTVLVALLGVLAFSVWR